MLQAITRFAIAAPRRVVAVAAAMLVGAAVFGLPVVNKLSGGGFQDPTSQSSRATDLLRKKFHHTDQQMLIVLTDPAGAQSSQARRVATDIVDGLKRSPWVLNVSSAWTSRPPTAAQLVSKDGKSGMIVAGLKGGENKAQDYAGTLMHQLVHDRDGVTVRAGGMAVAYAEINQQNERDLVLMEAIAVPLSFAVLVWVLGGVVAAALPVAVGVLSIVGTMSVLRLISFSTEVSTYALDLSVAMGLALAIDYNLLIISRYREEFARSGDRDRALVRTMATAGRTVLFSATTVGLSMAVMALFPMDFLKSSAYTIVATAVIVAVAAVVVTPAVIALLGPRLDALDVRRWFAHQVPPRKKSWRDHAHQPVNSLFWYRSTRFVSRHAVPTGLSVVALLMLLGAPFLGVKWGFPDERVLPRSASARQVADMLDHDFPNGLGNSMSVVLPDAHGVTSADMQRYAAELSRIPDVSAVTAPTGTFVAGNLAGPPAAPTGMAHGSAYLTVASTAPLYSAASNTQLDRLQQVLPPAGRSVEVTGLAQINRDSVAAITQRLPAVLVLIALITFVLLFMLTGSAVIPLQALVCNVLSLTAAFGAMVWIFQDGHLGALGTTPNGTLNADIPVLLFCIALGLAMDYEVFLVSRIHEYWLATPAARETRPDAAQARAATDESTALGIAGIGRVVTTAALVMSISFAALIPAQVSFMRMLGVGLTLAVLADATLVRMVLVPAFLHLLGRWTWWAPTPLAWLRERSVTGEEGARAVGRRRWAVDAAQPAAGFTGWPDGRPESSGRPHGPVSEPSAAATTAFAGFRAERRFSDAHTRGGSAPAARVEPRAWTATPAYYRGDDRRATGHPWRYPEPSTNRLLRQLKPAPSQGWRRWVYTLSGRLINPGESPRVIRYRGLAAYANRPFRGCYKIAVVSLKGGVGKTTITACLGATFASIRGDRVVAVDANPDHGTLGQRVPRETPATVRHLLRDAEGIRHYGDVRSYTSQGPSRLEVLASESDPAMSEAFSAEDYSRTLEILERFYGLVLTDCGTGLLQSAMSAVLATTDCLIVVSSVSIDGARSASATLDWLDAHGHQDLVRGAIAVINGVRPRSGRVDMQKVIDHFARRCRAVRLVPFDPHLEEGAEISLDRLKRATREALIELAAVVADGFPAVERLSAAFV